MSTKTVLYLSKSLMSRDKVISCRSKCSQFVASDFDNNSIHLLVLRKLDTAGFSAQLTASPLDALKLKTGLQHNRTLSTWQIQHKQKTKLVC